MNVTLTRCAYVDTNFPCTFQYQHILLSRLRSSIPRPRPKLWVSGPRADCTNHT